MLTVMAECELTEQLPIMCQIGQYTDNDAPRLKYQLRDIIFEYGTNRLAFSGFFCVTQLLEFKKID